MKYIVMICVCVLLACASMKPEQLTSEYKIAAVDPLENVYIISSNNSINKYQQRLLKFSQNYKIYGNITSIDVSNPMELYVFYRESNNIVFLDNTLSFRGMLDLSKTSIGLASAICRSYDNGLWVFDQTDLQLKKLNKNGDILQTSGNPLNLSALQLNPIYMIDDGSSVYMSDTATGIIITDLNAIYKRTIPIKGVRQFYIDQNKLYYCQKGKVYIVDLSIYENKELYQLNNLKSRHVFVNSKALVYACKDSVFCVEKFR